MTNLSVRSLVAAAGIPLLLACAFLGGFPFFVLVCAMSALGLVEYAGLVRAKGSEPQMGVAVVFTVAIVAVFLHERLHLLLSGLLVPLGLAVPLPSMSQGFLIVMLLFIPLLLTVELFRNRPNPIANIASTLLGVLYPGLCFGSLVGLREVFVPEEFPVTKHFGLQGLSTSDAIVAQIDVWGGMTVCTIFASIWACDSAAYFAGRAFGKNRLWPRISPNKTREGALAGFVAAIVVFLVANRLVLPFLSLGEVLMCGVIVGAVGQLGDLVESLFKRDAGMKDSSALIPGHGGVLDRFDSLLLVSPLLYLYFEFIIFAR
jgi:phosphatidate cytidylyltransferase